MTRKKPASKRTTPKKSRSAADATLEDIPLLSSHLGDVEPPKWDADGMLDAYKTVVHHVDICLDPGLGAAKQEAAKVLGKAYQDVIQFPQSDKAREIYDDAKAAFDEAVEAAADATVRFVARAMPRPEYDALTALPEMRPTDTQQAAWKAKCEAEGIKYAPLSWNPETFPPALMSQCMVEPELTLEQAARIWAEWSDAQSGILFDLCQRVQRIVY